MKNSNLYMNLPSAVLTVILLFVSTACDFKRSGSTDSNPGGAKTLNINDTLIPPQVGNFKRTEAPKSKHVNGLDLPPVHKEQLSASYPVPDDKDQVHFSYAKLYDEKQLKDWVRQMISNSTEDCKDFDAENLDSAQQQGQHYKIVRREPRDGGEIIVMHKDPNSLCNKGQKEIYEKTYFVRGDTVFAAVRYDFKNHGAAEQFISEFIKTRATR